MKRFAALLCMLVCLCLTVGAMADTGATLVRDGLVNTEWIRATDRLSVEGEPIGHSGSYYRSYSMITLEGTPLTESIYANLKGQMGYVVATSLLSEDLMNADGLLDLDGNVLIPCEYGDIDVLSTEWAVGVKLLESTAENYDYRAWFGDGKYLIDTVDVYHLPEGAKMATFARSEYNGARAINHCVNIENRATGEITTYDASFTPLGVVSYSSSDDYAPADYEKYYEDRHYGIRDAEGNVLLPPTYATIYSAYQGAARAKADNDKSGLITEQGALLVPAEYDDILFSYKLPDVAGETSGHIAAGYVAVELDKKLGFVDLNGNVTCAPKYIAENMKLNGASATVTDNMTGSMIMLAADGVETVIDNYASDDVYALSYGSGVFYQVKDESRNYGMIDWHGNLILPCEYRSIDLSSDGKYALARIDSKTANLYELTYPEVAAVAAPAKATGAPTETEAAAEAGAAPAQEGTNPVKTLLDNAGTLLSTDAATNASATVALLKSAVTLLGSDNDAAVNLLNNAINLLETDAATNAAAVAMLLESTAALL